MCWRSASGCLISAALVCFGAVGVAFGDPPGDAITRPPYEQPRQDAASTNPPRAPAPASQQPERRAYTADYERACDQPESREEADLCQQWRMAEASEELVDLTRQQLWAIIVETALLILAVGCAALSAFEASRAVRAATEANRLNRESLIAEQRAWAALKSISITSPLTWTENGGRMSFRFHVKNIGKTPAMGVWINCKIHTDIYVPPQDAYGAFAAQARSRPLDLGYTVFPGGDMIQNTNLAIPADELNAYFASGKRWLERRGRGFFPILIGCIDYGLVDQKERRQTGFIYIIDRNPAMSEVIAIGPGFGDVPLKQLRLTSWPVGGGTIAD